MYFRFRASLYPCPETPQERKEMASGVNTRIDDLQMVKQIGSMLFVCLIDSCITLWILLKEEKRWPY